MYIVVFVYFQGLFDVVSMHALCSIQLFVTCFSGLLFNCYMGQQNSKHGHGEDYIIATIQKHEELDYIKIN